MIQKGNSLLLKQQIQETLIIDESNERQQKKQQSVCFQQEDILDYALLLEFKIDQIKKQIQSENQEFSLTLINLLNMFDFQDVSESQIQEYLEGQTQVKAGKQIDFLDEIINLKTNYNLRPKNNIIKISLVDNTIKKKHVKTDDESKKKKKIKLNQENGFIQNGITSINENTALFNNDQVIQQDQVNKNCLQDIANFNNQNNGYYQQLQIDKQ